MVAGKETPRLDGMDTVQGALDTIERYFDNGWTDGLPIVPLTEELVGRMLEASGRAPHGGPGHHPAPYGSGYGRGGGYQCGNGRVPSRIYTGRYRGGGGSCRRALRPSGSPGHQRPTRSDDHRRRTGVQQVGINHGVGLFGHGSRANATIGRALRLVLVNLGGGHPDTGDKFTLGSPSKYSYCVGVDVDTPWAPLHTEIGFDAQDSCVIVYAADGPRGNNPAGSGSMEFALWILADSMPNLNPNIIGGGHAAVVISPLIAYKLSEEGWTKDEVKSYVFERARVPVERVRRYKELRYGRAAEDTDSYDWPKWLNVDEPNITGPVVRKPENIMVLVAGDPGRSRSAYCPARAFNLPVTKKFRMPGG